MRIGIIGAGIFGLASALELRHRGHDVRDARKIVIDLPRSLFHGFIVVLGTGTGTGTGAQ